MHARSMGSFFCLLACGLSSAGELAKVSVDPFNITASPWDIGSPDLVVDGRVDTLMRSANVNPAYVQFKLDADVGVKALRACLGQIGFAWAEADTWWVEAADTPSDLEVKGGTYRLVVEPRSGVDGRWDEVILNESVSRHLWRFNVERTLGDDCVHIVELELWTEISDCAPIAVESVPDATSVALHWDSPASLMVKGFEIYRDGVRVGTTPNSMRDYTDYGLQPEWGYSYQIVGLGEDGIPRGRSAPHLVRTTSWMAIKTEYRALVLYYNPRIWKDGRLITVREAYGCRDVDNLCQEFISLLDRASGGQVRFSVVDRFELDEFPRDTNPAMPFTAENYDQYRSEGFRSSGDREADYFAICNDPRFQINPRVEVGDVDAIWVFAPDGTAFWETVMAGRGAYWINGRPQPNVRCSKRFVIYGFGMAAHQGVGFMCENTAHMAENIMAWRIAMAWPRTHAVTGWNTLDLTQPGRSPEIRMQNDWEYFITSDAMHWDVQHVAPRQSQAGLSHYPPTACNNYGWSAALHNFTGSELDWFQAYGGQWHHEDGTFSVEAGPGHKAILYSGDRLTDSFGAYRVPLIITDAEVETGVRISAGTPAAHAGLLLRCSRYAIGESELCGYYIGLNPDRDCVEVALLDHGYTPLAEQPVRIDNDTFYLLRARLRDSTIEVMLGADPSPLLTVEDATAWVDGAVGLTAYGAAAAFSHLYVTPTIQNYAESWRTYPELGSTPRTLSPLEWRGDGRPYHDNDCFFAWWYEHLPKNPGTHDVQDPASGQVLGQVLNSWWPYLFDINRFDTPFLPDIDILSAPPDTVPPASPGNARGIGTGPGTTRIEWDQPEDDVGVTRYEVYRDGQSLQQTPLHYFIDEHLAPETTYSYQVRARDGSGNVSVPSSALLVSTFSPGIQLWNGDFEQGLATPVRWQPDAFHYSAVFVWDMPGTGRGATRCVRIEAVELNDARWMQEVTGLVPEGVYRLSGWIKGECILLESGAFAGANLCAMGTWDHSEPPLTGTFDWTRVEVQVRASAAGRLTVGCRLGYWSSRARGVAWFDDITLELVMDPRNRPPEANDDVLVAIQDTPIHVPVLELLGNDADPDDDSLSLTALSPTSLEGGIVILEEQEFCYTPPTGFIGPDRFTYTIGDGRGGAAQGTVLITVHPPVNQPPSFVKGPDVAVVENAGPQTLAGWAGEISAGSPDETGQSLNFEVSADAPSLFTELPAVSADGTLTFTTGPDCYGSTRVTVVLKDDGGIQHGGQDSSAAQAFLIIVRPTLYPPRLTVEVSFDTRLTFTWPAIWGYTYCVRYKDALDDPEWRGLPAQVVTEGNLCRFTADLAEATAHRFYRVEASP